MKKKQFMRGKWSAALRRIAGCAAFLSIIGFSFVKLGYLAAPELDGLNREYFPSFYAEEENTLDIVSIGSSAMYRSINVPMIYEETGLTNYNLGSAAMPGQAYINMIKEVKKTQDPQLFILEMRCFIRPRIHEPAIRRMTNNMDSSLNRISLITKLVDDPMQWDEYIFRLSQYHTQLGEVWKELVQISDPEELESELELLDNVRAVNNKGWNNITTVRKKLNTLKFDENAEPVPIDEESQEALDELLAYCKKENVPVLFVMTPFFITPTESGMSLYIEDTIREAGFDCINMPAMMDEMGMDRVQDFYDANHTNYFGSQKATKVICDYIEENFDLKAEHPQEILAHWNAYLEFNHDFVEKKISRMKEAAAEAADELETETEEM